MQTVVTELLKKATDYNCMQWFPYRDESVIKVEEFFNKQNNELALSDLFNIVREDASLYILFLKELSQHYISLGKQQKISGDIFNNVSSCHLRGAYEKIKLFKPNHSANGLTEAQDLRLKEMLLAATTSSIIASNQQIHSDFTFSTALLRQLGHTLIAWNYPLIYNKVTAKSKTHEEIESDLRKCLGFSASMLGYSVTEKLGLSRFFGAALPKDVDNFKFYNRANSKRMSLHQQVSKICEIGEALARSINPGIYITSDCDFKNACDTIKSKLGPNS